MLDSCLSQGVSPERVFSKENKLTILLVFIRCLPVAPGGLRSLDAMAFCSLVEGTCGGLAGSSC